MVWPLILLLGGVLGAALALVLLAHRRAVDAQRRLGELEERVHHLQQRVSRMDDTAFVTQSVLVDRGVLDPVALAEARERLVERPRRVQEEQQQLLRGVADREHLLERMVTPPVERKH